MKGRDRKSGDMDYHSWLVFYQLFVDSEKNGGGTLGIPMMLSDTDDSKWIHLHEQLSIKVSGDCWIISVPKKVFTLAGPFLESICAFGFICTCNEAMNWLGMQVCCGFMSRVAKMIMGRIETICTRE